MTISRICSPAPLKGRNTKVCMWGEVRNVITPIEFDVNRFRGFRSLGCKIRGFPSTRRVALTTVLQTVTIVLASRLSSSQYGVHWAQQCILCVAPVGPMKLAITVDNVATELYVDGALTPLANRGVWERVDTITIPADTHVIAVKGRDVGVSSSLIW